MIIATAYSLKDAKEKQKAAEILMGKYEFEMLLYGGNITTIRECVFDSIGGVSVLSIGSKRVHALVDKSPMYLYPGDDFQIDFVI